VGSGLSGNSLLRYHARRFFYGLIPVTEVMTKDEIKSNYELNTGKVIVRRFAGLDPMQMPEF
jgi:ribulose-5-phosphate 4-epimerase/fuculose-1-phosphate aldolase